ncbi:MAG: class I SAM-dependent methyltransferase [Gammaproteobacteria bacterium]|nr:class I SAM-dependent methyltransferase [Gammaproteobacteria bacterium]
MEIKSSPVKLLLLDEARREEADFLAQSLGVKCVAEESVDTLRYLVFAHQYTGLRYREIGKHNDIYVDFIGGKVGHRHRQGEGRGQTLARAIGIKANYRPRVLDVTAGLGRDGFVLASLGCKVTLLERSPWLHALLRDGMSRASQDESAALVINRMQLHYSDALSFLAKLAKDEKPDVIYLDPMYPHREKSALVKKEMRVIRAFVGDDTDTQTVLDMAIRSAMKRIVVKRPKTASPIDEERVNFSVAGKNTRYDVYLPVEQN